MPHPKAGYYLQDGRRVPGVTTVIGRFKDSSGLMLWAFNQGKEGKATLYEEAEKAADIGTLAHAMVEAHILKKEVEMKTSVIDPVTLDKAQQAFEMYQEWAAQTRLEVIDTEMSLVSERYRYGGTPDAIGLVNGKLSLLDWKTSNSVYVDHLVQVAAYAHLWEETNPDGLKLDGGYHILRFSKDHPDFAHRHYFELSDAWEQFKHFREAYDLDKKLKKRVG